MGFNAWIYGIFVETYVNKIIFIFSLILSLKFSVPMVYNKRHGPHRSPEHISNKTTREALVFNLFLFDIFILIS